MKSILLTGFNGFLGSYFERILKSNSSIILTRLGRNPNADIVVDFVNEIPVLRQKYDLVIHAAGKAHFIPRTFSDDDLFYKINVEGTRNLLESLSRSYIPKEFVFISSVSVYGSIKGDFIDEHASLSAQDPYGKSKIEAEKIILEWCRANNTVCTILRLPIVIGSNAPGNLKSMVSAIKLGYYFDISSGIAQKSMVLAEDIANHLLQASVIGGIYNLTDGYHPTFVELSNEISTQLGKRKIYKIPKGVAFFLGIIGDLLGDKFPINSNKFIKITSTLTFSDSAARSAFGWTPRPVLGNFCI